jgi:hypothetical protein
MEGMDVGGIITLKLFIKKKGMRGILNTVMNFHVP